jgi:2-keto-4-pentenoate hydratase/2-oxohepta-3-ene-1,7-dioic acid hydratase in catechol pathway
MRLDPPQFLRSGDRVRIAIDALGEIEHSVE